MILFHINMDGTFGVGLLCLSFVVLSNEDISLNNDFKFIIFSLNVNMEIYRGGHPCLLTLLRAAILFV